MKKEYNFVSNQQFNGGFCSGNKDPVHIDVKRWQQMQEAIEIERSRICKDLHDEIGSELTRIALLSELIQTKSNDVQYIKKDVETIAAAARNLVQSMSEVIWALNPQNETLESLLAYIREQSQLYFEPFNIAFTISFPVEVPTVNLTNEERRNLYLVTKELLHNAMQHSKGTQINLSLEIFNTELRFSVADNGIGFSDKGPRIGSNGLRNLKKRMQDIGGNIDWLKANPGTLVKYNVIV